jgi:hypothetical protein
MSQWPIYILGFLGVLVGIFALLPRRLLARVSQAAASGPPRAYAGACALAILVGLFIPHLLGG